MHAILIHLRQPYLAARALGSLVALAAVLGLTFAAHAQSQTSLSGHIIGTYVSSPTNEAFRVTLDTPMPGCVDDFAYVNQNEPAFEYYVSSLMTAYATGQRVTLLVIPDGNSFCHINEAGTAK